MMDDDDLAGLTSSSDWSGEGDALEALAALPIHDLRAPAAERVRMRGHAALARAQRGSVTRLQWARSAYGRAEPVLVSALAVLYLLVAVQAVLPQ